MLRESKLQIHVMYTGSCLAKIHHHPHSTRGIRSENTVTGCEWSKREVSGSRVGPTTPATIHSNYEFSILTRRVKETAKRRKSE